MTSAGVNAIESELFTHRFTHLVEEMGVMLQRTALSTNVKERMDFSCALLDVDGELVANAPHIPVHLGAMGLCVRSVVSKYPLGPGDMIVTNHPHRMALPAIYPDSVPQTAGGLWRSGVHASFQAPRFLWSHRHG